MPVVLPITLCFISGYLAVSLGWPAARRGEDLLLRGSLTVGFGIAIFSLYFVVSRLLDLSFFPALKLLPFLVLIAVLAARKKGSRIEGRAREDIALPLWCHRALFCSVVFAVLAALHSLLRRAIAHPHGDGWDAFAIWNLHARFLFLGGPDWRNGFTALIPWSHPDYPVLLPAAIAHFWSYLGSDNPLVPAVISVIFALITLALLYSSLYRLRGANAAMLGTLTLASTPFFISQGASQCADVPLSFYFLATIALLCLQSWHVHGSNGIIALAGLSAGCAAWTKNEGILFLFAAIVGQVFVLFTKRKPEPSMRQSRAFLSFISFVLGAIPFVVLILWFKHLAPPVDLFSTPASIPAKLMTFNRYWVILNWYVKEFFRFGEWWIVPGTVLLAILYLTNTSKPPQPLTLAYRASAWSLGLTLAGYFAIYVITPRELQWHLRTSLNRLFLQLWPSVIFLLFSSVSFRSFDNVSK